MSDDLALRTEQQLRLLIGDLVLTVARQRAQIEQLQATKGNGQAHDAPATGTRGTDPQPASVRGPYGSD